MVKGLLHTDSPQANATPALRSIYACRNAVCCGFLIAVGLCAAVINGNLCAIRIVVDYIQCPCPFVRSGEGR